MKIGFAMLCLLIASAAPSFPRAGTFPKISGPYLGQPPRGHSGGLRAGDRVDRARRPEFCPQLSPDGKYLFFTSYRIGPGRVPEAPWAMADFIRVHNLPGNGLGDIY
jgi:hypothetical protein